MPVVLLAAAAVVAAVLLAGGKAAPAAPPPRKYTKADLPKLRELSLRRAGFGRELNICIMKQGEGSLFNVQETIGFGVGLFTGAYTGDFTKGLKAARLTTAALTKLKGEEDVPCKAEMLLTVQQGKDIDRVTTELGLPLDVTTEQIQAIVASLGGFEKEFGFAHGPFYEACVKQKGSVGTFCREATVKAYYDCVNKHGADACRDFVSDGVIYQPTAKAAPPVRRKGT